MNEPRSVEGWQAWDLLLRSGNQLRILRRTVVGLDLSAALALGEALGLPPFVAAEFLTDAEATIVAALNRAIDDA